MSRLGARTAGSTAAPARSGRPPARDHGAHQVGPLGRQRKGGSGARAGAKHTEWQVMGQAEVGQPVGRRAKAAHQLGDIETGSGIVVLAFGEQIHQQGAKTAIAQRRRKGIIAR
jgi:hypothetical protein